MVMLVRVNDSFYYLPPSCHVDIKRLAHNGPAIWGGCVPAFFSKKRDGALFAVRVQIMLSITRVAVQCLSEPEICQGAES